MFNKGDSEATLRCLLNDAGLSADSGYGFQLKDLFTGEVSGPVTEMLAAKVAPHDCKVYRATLVKLS